MLEDLGDRWQEAAQDRDVGAFHRVGSGSERFLRYSNECPPVLAMAPRAPLSAWAAVAGRAGITRNSQGPLVVVGRCEENGRARIAHQQATYD